MKRALVVGVDAYDNISALNGCVNDASAIAQILESNGDGSPNFSVRLLTSDNDRVDAATLHSAICDLFNTDAETALLYFAGHGLIQAETNAGYLVSSDAKKGSWGVSLAEVLNLANGAYPKIKSTVIILDSCQSGFAGEATGLGAASVSIIGSGVTILTACHRSGTASEFQGHGLFTGILLDGLQGGSADICGHITPASLYSHVDQTLGPWEQRPIYKANVHTFITLRSIPPKVPLDVLRRLPKYFPDRAFEFQLDPSFEADRAHVPDPIKNFPVNPDNVRIFKELQQCNRHGLVLPVGAEHMYYAALHSKRCKLTALGAHYRKLAEMSRL